MARYPKRKVGEWQQPITNGYKMRCCDCGLVHLVDFRIHEGRIQFRMFRDDRATSQSRRQRRELAREG